VATEHDETKVEPRLSHLTITAPAGVEVRRGDAIVPSDSYGKPIAIDGGTYTLVARSGIARWTSTVTIGAERDAQAVQVPVLKPDAPGGEPARDRRANPLALRAEPPSRALPIGVAAGAVALGAVAIVLELSARSTYDDAKREPDDMRQHDLWQRANHKRYAAEGVGLAGAAAAGVAVWLFVRGDHREEPRVSVAPLVTGEQLGLAIGGRY